MDTKPFLIVGGGIAGLAASLGLARVNQTSRLFEQAPSFEEVGAGLQMSPNGVRALQWLGAWDAVEPFCVSPSEIHIRDGRSGALLQRILLGKDFEARFGAPYRVAHRADLMAGLVEQARASDMIELNTGAEGISALIAEPASLGFADGRQEQGAAVIAADGIHSRLRQEFWPASAARHYGHDIHRALIPFASVPADIASDCVTLWLCPGGHVVHYPVSNWRQFNIVAATDSGVDWRTIFGATAPELADLLAVPETWTDWVAADLAPLASWSKGNLVLMGDAAHAALPYLAQGTAMALEDACALATSIASEASTPEAFQRYQSLRIPRTTLIQDDARSLAKHYHARGLGALARNTAIKLMQSAGMIEKYNWIYDWQAPS